MENFSLISADAQQIGLAGTKGLKSEIESFWQCLKETNLFYRKIFDGQITGNQVGRLLSSTRYLIHQTPKHLVMAVERARSHRSLSTLLQKYFEEHTQVDFDHDRWAKEGLEELQKICSCVDDSVSPKMIAFVENIEDLINKDVALYLPYILWVEYLCVAGAWDLADDLRNYCNIPAHVLAVFTKRADRDRQHAADDLGIIDRVVEADPSYGPKFLHVIKHTGKLYSEFWEEISRP